MKEKRYMTIIKSLLLVAASFAFLSCSNLFGDSSSESSTTEKSSSDKTQTITITGNISISDELKESGALPAEYLFLFNQINDSNERSAFPSTSSTNYYATAIADGKDAVNGTITTTATGASFTMAIPIDDTSTDWTIEAGLKDTFNTSTVTILKDTFSKSFSNTDPSFSHDFIIRPLTEGSGNIDLTIGSTTSDANTPDTLELYLDGASEPVSAGTGETISTSKITLKNRATGTYKARLVFKKNGYVVFTDYQGITVFPNMTTNTWVNSKSGGYTTINGSGVYKLTDALVEDYLITQIYVGNVTIGSTTISGKDDKGNGTIFAPFATFAKAVTFLKENGKEDKDYTIWISGEITGAQTISDTTGNTSTPVLAKSLTISGVTGNTSDSLNGGNDGSVLTVNTGKTVTIENLKITGGNADTGGGINITKGTVTLSTGALIADNSAITSGGAIYVSTNGTLKIASSAKVTKVNDSAISDKHNDIYLSASKTLEIVETLDSTATATITLPSLVRGKQVLSGSCTSSNVEKIHVSDSEWNIISHSNVGKLDAPLYVSSATGASDSNTGTALHPYVTVKQATMQVWNTADDNETTINIVGEVTGVAGGATGAQQYIEVSASVTNPKIRLKGTTNTAKINPNPNNGTENRKALGINSKVDLTIEQLTITGGNTTGHGAGIYSNIAGVTLTLDTGAIVSGNTVNNTSGYAGGIYITGSNNDRAKLIMKTGSQIKGNYAVNGGGVYLSYADLCMSGTALIGESATSPATNTTGGNKGTNGGGVYVASSGCIWLGYSAPSDNENAVLALTDGYGILHNYASACGGGIYNNGGTVKMKTGAISYNGTPTKSSSAYGGGIYNLKGTVNLSGGQITRNQTSYGGGIYSSGEYNAVDAKVFLTGTALIGGSGTGNASETTGNYAIPYQNTLYAGGGIFNTGGNIYLGYASCGNDGNPSNKTSLTGGICQNYASYQSQPSAQNTAYAGGVYMTNYGKLYFDSGNISYNSAGSGGGIYMDVNWNVLAMTGGTIAGNLAVNTSEGKGGAVYIVSLNGGSLGTSISNFELSGTTASIPSTGIRNNDIYLNASKITINGNLGNSFAAKITSSSYSDGKQVLEPQSDSDTDIAYITNNFTKFSLTSPSYYIISNGTIFGSPSVKSVTTFESGKTYAACSQADLAHVATTVNSSSTGLSGVTIKLANNITLTGSYTPIGSNSNNFGGKFDGNGKTITYSEVTEFTSHCSGIIGYVNGSDSEIKNLSVAGAFSSSANYTGGIVGYINYPESCLIKNCSSSVNITGTAEYVGGIIGSANSKSGERTVIIDGCKNTGAVSSTKENGYGCGGIVGDAARCIFRNCINTGNITGVFLVGGIVGNHSGSTVDYGQTGHGCELYNCGNTGVITASPYPSSKDAYAGGISGGQNSGNSEWGPKFECCFSSGTIKLSGTTSDASKARGIDGHNLTISKWDGDVVNCFYYSNSAPDGGAILYSSGIGNEKTTVYTSASSVLDTLNSLNSSDSSTYKKWKVSGTGFEFDE